jgi:hypothetical protein
MFLSGVQSEFRLDSHLKHAGMTDLEIACSKLRRIEAAEIKLGEIHG